MKEITIYDIAKEAGVSPATVSRVMNGSVNVRDEKKTRILQVIDKYNYRPNPHARSLIDTKTKLLGILTADIRNPFYGSLFIACEKAAMKKGYTVVLCNSLNENQVEDHYLNVFEDQRVDGILLIGGRVDELISDPNYVRHINRLSNRMPIVVTGKLDGSDTYQVNIDQIQAVEQALGHLLDYGHKKIALLGGASMVKSTADKRLRFLQLMDKYALPVRGSYMSDISTYDDDGGYLEMTKLLNSPNRPTAVIAINDNFAIGVLRAIYEKGLRVPEDISIISFDNTMLSKMCIPPLTSVDYDYDAYGSTLINSMVDLLEGKTIPRVQHISTRLIPRSSCLKLTQ